MSPVATVTIHHSQFPGKVRDDLIESLRSGQVNHKFHYDSVKQTQKWLALHQVFSPSRTDADCATAYDRSFQSVAARIAGRRVHVIGLGCGGGQKDTRLLGLLKRKGRKVFYTPCDVSVAMVLTARQTALAHIRVPDCFPLVCDLATAEDLATAFGAGAPRAAARLLTFFGMVPNFEPQVILPKLAAFVRRGDWLLFSANLAPGANYTAGMRRILPQYDNRLTREWLLTFLLDLGVLRDDGELRFCIEGDPAGSGLKRVTAHFRFFRTSTIRLDAGSFKFRRGASIRLFFSYRYTPASVRLQLRQYGLQVLDEWIAGSQEEGVFLCCRRKAS